MRARRLTRSGKWISYSILKPKPPSRFYELAEHYLLMTEMRKWCTANLADQFFVKRHNDNSIVCLVTNTLDLMRVMSEFPNE